MLYIAHLVSTCSSKSHVRISHTPARERNDLLPKKIERRLKNVPYPENSPLEKGIFVKPASLCQ